MVAMQLNRAPRDFKMVTGMIGSDAYRVSMTRNKARIANEAIMGAMGILGEARLKSRRTRDEVCPYYQQLVRKNIKANVLTNVTMPA